MSKRSAYIQMHTAIVLWGFTAILGKLITLEEGQLVWYRMMLSSIATLIFLLATKRFYKPTFKELRHIAGIGAVITLHWITFYGAIKASNVSVAISCFSSVALFTALLSPLLNRSLPRLKEIVLALLVAGGILIIFSSQQVYGKGILLSLISAFLASLFTILNKQISHRYNPVALTFYELGTGFLFLTCALPFWLKTNNLHVQFPNLSDFLYLVVLSVVCTTIAFSLSLQALKKLDAFTMNLSVNLEPVYSIVLAFVLFHENNFLNGGFYLGTAIILSAIAIHGFLELKTYRQYRKSDIT